LGRLRGMILQIRYLRISVWEN